MEGEEAPFFQWQGVHSGRWLVCVIYQRVVSWLVLASRGRRGGHADAATLCLQNGPPGLQ